eukprot:TRINITY_DN3079_c0_g2_i2.p1 TRINITY_DN3079_c0_g2~~TRINITY_DN3079_c0_g2_i2.p1  ORF type:complete len:467 (+),score=99.67 TRINITY_DN3079_c0_g2_i2:118-1518(+)
MISAMRLVLTSLALFRAVLASVVDDMSNDCEDELISAQVLLQKAASFSSRANNLKQNIQTELRSTENRTKTKQVHPKLFSSRPTAEDESKSLRKAISLSSRPHDKLKLSTSSSGADDKTEKSLQKSTARTPDHESLTSYGKQILDNFATEDVAYKDLQTSLIEDETKNVMFLVKKVKDNWCNALLFLLIFMCCCGGLLRAAIGETATSAVSFIASAGTVVYLLYSGIYQQWWHGEHVGEACYWLSVWAFLGFCFWGCLICCISVGLVGGLVIKNMVVKRIRRAFEEKEATLSGPRKAYYESDAFKELCNELFDKADKDKGGELDMNELRDIIADVIGSAEVAATTPLFLEAFDDNGDSKVNRAEFVEMMKFFSVIRLEMETSRHVKSISKYYELLQLRDGAPLEQVRKSYHKLAREWHPDKRRGVDQQEASKDMAEVQEAYDEVCKYLQADEDEKKRINQGGCVQN